MDIKLICDGKEINYNGMTGIVPFSFYGTILFFDNNIVKPKNQIKRWTNRYFAYNNLIIYKNLFES